MKHRSFKQLVKLTTSMAKQYQLVFLLFILSNQANSQLVCNQCLNSNNGMGDCGREQRCTSEEPRCLAIRRDVDDLLGNVGTIYETRCASSTECSSSNLRNICPGDDCQAQCCSTNKCDPFVLMSRESLDTCTHSRQRCDEDQDVCLSLLMEGGNDPKSYYKRCARRDECTESELNRLCNEHMDEFTQKQCRATCCHEEMCNTSSFHMISLILLACVFLLVLAAN
ncbi:uncharacterized protein LOC124452266 [Xenia sp. Carnegie-2017]|uniref:uncharacterized protein LOC124452266 n=1 Tax=Xenia sp. Carnegie-2017 TaxID=2897299 RepID=UPI001F04B0BA|nr:uncharacterized protein LOC124452266 [Xenia sp. Carnegie-2017]